MASRSVYCEEAERWLEIPAVYKHFKHTENGEPNNYLYCTMGVSEAYSMDTIVLNNLKVVAKVMHTETEKTICIYNLDGKYIHLDEDSEDTLVLYKSLYDDTGIYGRPIAMFLSEVDRNQYPNVAQKYRMELIK